MAIEQFARPMHRLFAVLVAALIIPNGFSAFAAEVTESTDRQVIGRWKLVAALDAAEISSLDEHEARQLLGRTFIIQQEKVEFGQRRCLPPSLEAERVEPNLYLRERFHARSKLLRLPNPVTVVDLGCTTAFVKNSNRLVIAWQGWFFDAVRVKR